MRSSLLHAGLVALFLIPACNNAGLTGETKHAEKKKKATNESAFGKGKGKGDNDPKNKAALKDGTDKGSGSGSGSSSGSGSQKNKKGKTDGETDAAGKDKGLNGGSNDGSSSTSGDTDTAGGGGSGPGLDTGSGSKAGGDLTIQNDESAKPAPKFTLTGPVNNFCFNDRSEDAGTNFGISTKAQGVIIQFYDAVPGNSAAHGALAYTLDDPTIGMQIATQVVARGPINVQVPLPPQLKPGSCYHMAFFDKLKPGTLKKTYVASCNEHGNDPNDFSKGELNQGQDMVDDNLPMIGISAKEVCVSADGTTMSASMIVALADTNNENQLYPNACDEDNHISPIVVNFSSAPIALTSNVPGTAFDLDVDAKPEHVSWTDSKDVCFLVVDRNANGKIDNGAELFGNFTPGKDGKTTPNGFEALKSYKDLISAPSSCARAIASELLAPGEAASYLCDGDADASGLRFWCDANRNGLTEAGEIQTLAERNVAAISIAYEHISAVDEYNNETRESSHVVGLDKAGAPTFFHSFDIWFYVKR